MKVKKIYALLMPLTIGLASLTSCSSDNNKDNNTTRPERGDVTSFDQVKYLQNNIIEVDSLGNMVQRVSGEPLDASDTTVLSIHAADVNAATEIFKGWLSSDTQVSTISPSTVDLQANLKDGDGNEKETVYFKAVTGGDNVAEVTFKNGGVLKHFSKIKFISSWPENGASEFSVGTTFTSTTYEGSGSWVCVKEAQKGIAGLLVHLSDKATTTNKKMSENFATPSLATAASNEMKKNWNYFVEKFQYAKMNLTSGEYFWIDDWKFFVVGGGIYAIRLNDGDIDWFDIVWNSPEKRNIQIKTFGLRKD